MSELKKYLQEQYIMPEHRDVEDFALEMLRTTKANLEYHQKRTQALIASADLERHAKDAIREAESLLRITNQLVVLEKTQHEEPA